MVDKLGQPQPSRQEGAPAVFLDRDGTLNREVHYLGDPDQLELLPGAAEGLRRLRAAGFRLVVITNQAGVARGYFSEKDVQRVHARLQALLRARGAEVDAFYYCPHHPEGQGAYRRACPGRKPGTALYERAARELGLDLARSFVVGDKDTDLQPGIALGCRTILLRTGYGQALLDAGALDGMPIDHVADDLQAAATWILAAIPSMCTRQKR
jgi:D-glycero-D-manno-heptose 1,7-bisphosphate phosphatase